MPFAPNSPAAISDRHGHWGIQPLWEQLTRWWPDLSIEVVDSIGSTNQALVERLHLAARNAQGRSRRGDDLSPTLLVAQQQTAGRGRLGRSWESAPGASLTFSLSLPVRRADWSGLSLTVGTAVADALDPLSAGGTPRIGLKWPNDLWLLDAPGRGRKLGGVLIEAVSLGQQRVAVIGIGLNVQPVQLDEPVASLSEILPDARPPLVLAQLMPLLAERLQAFEDAGFAAAAPAFAARDLLRGQRITTTDAHSPEGESLGVDHDGALLLRCGDETRRILSGEVSVRPAAGPAPRPPQA